VAWPFADVPYADLFPVVTERVNTTVSSEASDDTDNEDPTDSDATQDLAGVYATLCGGRFGEIDPFADSAGAVTAFEDGRFTALVCHNVADILRTRALGRVAQRYCSKSDFSMKSLTAVHDA
jgi:hypothetical protein